MTETPVSGSIRDRIGTELKAIEATEDVRIVLAVESGSRAWGFHSADSDYDVRFVYVRPEAWHYRIERMRDVIERPIDADLDISGWELRKALGLVLKSNAVIAEWLQSPIVYRRDNAVVGPLAEFAQTVLRPRALMWHHLSHLRRQQDRSRLGDGGVRLKGFFYTLRPALTLRWIRLHGTGMPPMDMARLMAQTDLSAALETSIGRLIREKVAASEQAVLRDVDSALTALVVEETRLAEAALADRSKIAQPGDFAAADALHLRLSKMAMGAE